MGHDRKNDPTTKKEIDMSILHRILTLFLCIHSKGDQKILFLNISWLRVNMYYRTFNNSAKLLKRYLAAKMRHGILSRDLIDR